MNCKKAQYLIQEYLEGELDTTERFELAQHLLQCATCREEMNQMEQADAYFSCQPWLTPPERLRENVMAKLHSEPERLEKEKLITKIKTWKVVRHISGNPNNGSIFWYILISFGQVGLATLALILIYSEWLLTEKWSYFFKRFAASEWNFLVLLKSTYVGASHRIETWKDTVESLFKSVYLDNSSFGSQINDFLVRPSFIKITVIFVILVLTFYLNKRFLFNRGSLSRNIF